MVFVNHSRGLGIHTTHILTESNVGSETDVGAATCTVLSFILWNILQMKRGGKKTHRLMKKLCPLNIDSIEIGKWEKTVNGREKYTDGKLIDPSSHTKGTEHISAIFGDCQVFNLSKKQAGGNTAFTKSMGNVIEKSLQKK